MNIGYFKPHHLVLIFVFLLNNSINVEASDKKKISLVEAIENISEKYKVYFTFDMTLVLDVEVEYGNISHSSAEEAISHILKETNLKYKFYDRRFVILYKEDEEGLESLRQMSRHLDGLISEGEKIITSAPKREIKAIPRLSSRFISKEIQRIAFTVEGKVVDQDGEPLIGVNIQVKGSNKGTATDFDGNFVLNGIDENAILVISYVGYQTHEIPIAGKSTLEIVMMSDSQLLDEVVVVGYGTQKKTSLTSAVSSMSGEKIESIPITNISNSIGGRLSGVIVKQSSGKPGRDNSNIYIRGISTIGGTQPLFVVDGIPRNFQDLDPNSIETFTVLKDAAAVAPYGVAGANGVILVTTKDGEKGKAVINYNGYLGFQNPTKMPDYVNGYEYALLKNLAAENVGLPKPYSDDALQKFQDGSDPDRYPPYYDLLGDLITKNALLNTHSMNISGGTDFINYYVNFGYQNQEGMWPSSYARRYNFNANFETNVSNTTKVSLKIGGINNFHTAPPTDSDGSESSSNTRLFELIKYSHPDFGPLFFSNGMMGGPASSAIYNGGYRDFNTTTIFSLLKVEQKIPFISGLSLSGAIAYDPEFSSINNWSPPSQMASLDVSQNPPVIKDGILGKTTPTYSEDWGRSRNMTYQAGINYNQNFRNHSLDIIGVFEARDGRSFSLGATRRNYSLYIDEVGMGSSSNDDMSTRGTSSANSQVGLVYRISYDYDGKYLAEASGRYDGHYYFAPDRRFGFFPAFSLGWRLSEEKYIKENWTWLYNMKLRASIGEVGALAGSPFQYLSTYGVSGPGYAIGGQGVQIVSERSEPNPNITWERARKTDFGIEFSVLRGSLNFEIDYFYEKRSNMLVAPNVITPLEYGVGLSQVNDAVMENKGVDFLGNFNFNITNDLVFGVSGTFTYAKNKVLQIFESSSTFDNPNRRRTGRPLGTQFGYKALGYFQLDDFDTEGNLKPGIPSQPWGKVQPGDLRYQDTNGDGKIDINDEVPIGDPSVPGIIYGFSPYINYKQFSLELLFQGAGKTSQYMTESAMWPFFNGRNAYKQNFDYWRPDNPDAAFPRLEPVPNDNYVQTSSWWMYDVNYLRMKNIKIAYSLPSHVINKAKINRAQIYFSGQNILTWSKSFVNQFYDPENTNSGGYEYPQQKVYSVGLQITI